METITSDNQLTVIDKSIEVFKGGSAIILSHQIRAAKALIVAESILKQWDAAYAIEDPEERKEALAAVDQRSNDFLHNCGQAKVQMEESRKAITQLMDMIKKMFTEEENKLDPKKDTRPAAIQSKRNAYAKFQFEEQERLRKEAELKAVKAKEAIEIQSSLKNSITTRLLTYLAEKKLAITNSFNAITLADFDDKSQRLRLMKCSFPLEKIPEIISSVERPDYRITNDLEAQGIINEGIQSFDFPLFYNEYERQITELKLSLIDKLPSKKEELLEQKRIADEAEEKRLVELKRQEEAEKKRQEQIQLANAAEKKRLEEQAVLAREEEAKKLQEMEKEAAAKKQQAEEEQHKREEEERLRLQAEAEDQKKRAEQLAEVSKASGTAQVLFDQAMESSVTAPAPEARVGYGIEVLHPAGWVEIFQFWFQREGCTMAADEMGKKSLNQMKAFAEAVAKKDNVLIESKHLNYETSVKSINRKTVK